MPKDELFLSTRPSVFQRTKKRNFDKQLADLHRLNTALRQPGHQAELEHMFDEISAATVTTEKKYLDIAGTMTLDNLMIILGNKLDVMQHNHQNILYWTLHGFGAHFKKHPLFSKILENLFRNEHQKHTFDNAQSVAEIQSLNNFAEKIKAFLEQGPDSTQEFFDKVPNILDIFSIETLQGFCLASKDFAKQCLQRSELRKVLCKDGNWIQALFDKYSKDLFIAYQALAMKDMLRTFNTDFHETKKRNN